MTSTKTESAYEVEIDLVSEQEWSDVLDLFSDASIFQTWAHSAVRWGDKSLSHCVLKQNGEIKAAAQIQIKRIPWLGIGIANVSWGPMYKRWNTETHLDIFNTMINALRTEYSQKRGLSLHVHCSEWCDLKLKLADIFVTAGYHPDETALPFRTVLIDLKQTEDEILMSFRKRWRKCLRKSFRNNLTVRETQSMEDYALSQKIFRDVVKRKQIHDAGDVDLFATIHERLPDRHKLKMIVCEMEGVPISTAVWSDLGERSMGLFRMNTEQALHKIYSSYLLTWENIIRNKKAGMQYYDEGGYNPEYSESDAFFKDGLNGLLVSHLPIYIVCDNPLSRFAIPLAQGCRKTMKAIQRFLAKRKPKPNTSNSTSGPDSRDE